MAVRQIYRLYGMVLDGAQFGGPITLGGLTTSSVSANAQVNQDYTDGNPHPTRTTIQNFAEELSFSTLNVDTALQVIGALSQCIDVGSSIVLYYARFTECNSGPAPGSVHRSITITQAGNSAGLIHAGSLTCDHRGDAQFSLMIKPKSDGINSPIVINQNIALPALVFDNRNRYTIGPVELDGNTIDGLKNVSLEFGIELDRESADSSIRDEFIGLKQTAAKITMSGINPEWWDTLGVNGNALAHADSSIVFRRRLPGGAGFEPPAETRHIRLTCAGLAVPTNYVSTNEQAPAEAGLEIYCDHDGTNVPIVAQSGIAY